MQLIAQHTIYQLKCLSEQIAVRQYATSKLQAEIIRVANHGTGSAFKKFIQSLEPKVNNEKVSTANKDSVHKPLPGLEYRNPT